MSRILIAAAAEGSRTQMSRLLTSSGYSVFRCCSSGSELRRTINDIQDGIVILIGSLPDVKVEELQWDYGNCIQLLWVAKPDLLESCEEPEVFRLSLPTSSQAVIGAVEMLTQLHQMLLPKRSSQQKAVIDQAKQLMMRRHQITEPEAHRALQQYAMRHGIKMEQYAMQILQSSRGTNSESIS